MKKKFWEIRSGSTVPHLACGQVKELAIPLPGLAKQIEIVDKLSNVGKEIQRLSSIYERELAALEELKKALLHQAFHGEL